MNNDELKKILTSFIERSIPPVVLHHTFFIVFRDTNLMLITADKLRIGDIRLLSLPAKDLVTGLSDGQWTELITKLRTLMNIVVFAKNNNLSAYLREIWTDGS